MQNILGIVDINCNLVVRYNYDAYGNLISYSGSNIYNPIRYKGYYFDEEVDMFYCKTRFYVAKWLGWLLTGAVLVGLTALSVFTLGVAAPISGVAAGVLIGATCGAYAGAITSVLSQGINSGWSNIDSWNVFKETRVGLVIGAISGLGTGIGTSILTGGISQITSGLFDGSISSFSDVLCQFAYGALISGVTYGLGEYISNKMATSKIGGIIGTSSKIVL